MAPRKKEEKEDAVFNTDNALAVAGIAAGKIPVVGDTASFALDVVASDRELEKAIRQASEMMGDDTRHLKANSPAFKKYLKDELPGIYEDRAIGYGFSLGGGAIAMAIAGMVFGLPGGLPGVLVGLLVGGVGATVAGYVKDMIFPSTYNTFLEFASNLQAVGQSKQMAPEEAFVALAMNLDDKSLRQIYSSLPKSFNVDDKGRFIRMLKSDAGREALRSAMVEHDALLRASTGAMTAVPGATLSEQFASLVNDGQLSGVDLLNQEKTGHIGVLISMSETQMIQQRMLASQHAAHPHAAGHSHNPNQQLPARGHTQEPVRG